MKGHVRSKHHEKHQPSLDFLHFFPDSRLNIRGIGQKHTSNPSTHFLIMHQISFLMKWRQMWWNCICFSSAPPLFGSFGCLFYTRKKCLKVPWDKSRSLRRITSYVVVTLGWSICPSKTCEMINGLWTVPQKKTANSSWTHQSRVKELSM